jgi:hypothetical protein
VVEVTNEMVYAFAEAYSKADDGSSKTILGGLAERAGIAAVLAIVERDWNMQPRPAGSHLPPTGPWTVPVDHEFVGDGPTCSQCTRSLRLHQGATEGGDPR